MRRVALELFGIAICGGVVGIGLLQFRYSVRRSRDRRPIIILSEIGIIRTDHENVPISWRDIRAVDRYHSDEDEICQLTSASGNVVTISTWSLVDASSYKFLRRAVHTRTLLTDPGSPILDDRGFVIKSV